ncbi:hypothetical protein ACQR16_32495 [Bradyrhizobium oligotrophicum]|uniref:hypothetical protein n=1 Tax=Bradyrhizobium oligotrophicum TaxID=44255 RepID=UPI003EBE5937
MSQPTEELLRGWLADSADACRAAARWQAGRPIGMAPVFHHGAGHHGRQERIFHGMLTVADAGLQLWLAMVAMSAVGMQSSPCASATDGGRGGAGAVIGRYDEIDGY